jgi:hypothetical protein
MLYNFPRIDLKKNFGNNNLTRSGKMETQNTCNLHSSLDRDQLAGPGDLTYSVTVLFPEQARQKECH